MKIITEHGSPVIDMGTWKVRLSVTSLGELDLNLSGDRMPRMCVIPQAGNVIRVKPDA